MRSLSDTIRRLNARRNFTLPEFNLPTMSDLPNLSDLPGMQPLGQPSGTLTPLDGFGSNPGALSAFSHVPADLPAGAPLVVVLHGCTQTAAAYDRGAGWSQLADEHGFALLYPEQRRANNANLCFNWFEPGDTRRDAGEAMSIRQMIAAMVRAHTLDANRIFVTGLSAGGAMTSVMLATYPEIFAGGAVIAGLPYGCATSVPEAFDRMRGHGTPTGAELGRRARSASAHDGPWPRVSVWHGSADTVVAPSNALAVIDQWREVHGIAPGAGARDMVDGHERRRWTGRDGVAVIESYSVAGMGHGTPVNPTGDDGAGAVGPHMLAASISSTRHIARFFGVDRPRVNGG